MSSSRSISSPLATHSFHEPGILRVMAGPECEHAFLDVGSVTGTQINPSLVFHNGNTGLSAMTSQRSAREPRAR
jgi:hypothetical protein